MEAVATAGSRELCAARDREHLLSLVELNCSQRSELTSIAQSRSLPAGYIFRAKLILMLAEGISFNTIKRRLQTSAPTIIRWMQRFLESGLDRLDTYHPGQKARVPTPALRARILSATRNKPGNGSTHWSCSKLATALGVSKDAVHRVWKEAGLKPHRLERYMASDDPQFLFISFALPLTPGTRKRPPQSGSVQTGFWEMCFLQFVARLWNREKVSAALSGSPTTARHWFPLLERCASP
jgi:transposase